VVGVNDCGERAAVQRPEFVERPTDRHQREDVDIIGSLALRRQRQFGLQAIR
jgi:hypothetical protein